MNKYSSLDKLNIVTIIVSVSRPTSALPFFPNVAGEIVNWLPYGKIAIPSVELYCPV